MTVAYMVNINELHLCYVMFDSLEQAAALLGACGRLRVLSVCCTDVVQPDLPFGPDSPPFDLSSLERLAIVNFSCISSMIMRSPPTELLSLSYVDFDIQDVRKIGTTTLQLLAPSFTNLDLVPYFTHISDTLQLVDLFSRLPAFLALHTLSISLTDAELVLNALDAAPALTALVLPILLFHDDRAGISHSLPSMKSLLTRKFPLLRRLGFQFCLAQLDNPF
ncbi:hypothetical protein C8R47DRAFT_1319605 [Mycena vitilis]|nr:hypothetical protein C8R47DRAFT_1319605 [Mycena vitilis]